MATLFLSQLHAATGAVVVDENLATFQGARHAHLTATVACPDTDHQAEGCAVGDAHRVGRDVLKGC